MKLNLSYQKVIEVTSAQMVGVKGNNLLQTVVFDTRNIIEGEDAIFFALQGNLRDGHSFIPDAYAKGVRCFVVSQRPDISLFKSATFLLVDDVLKALQQLATFHRKKFEYPVIAITGSAGKTMVKEWLYHLLSVQFKIVRSPKSYNSQLGVALSLLEMSDEYNLALIEAGISAPDDMRSLREMILPTHGVFTSFGQAHADNFKTKQLHLAEKLSLFESVECTFFNSSLQLSPDTIKKINGIEVGPDQFVKERNLLPFEDEASQLNGRLSIAVAKYFLGKEIDLKKQIATLPQLALRMELFEGKHQNLIINDSYNMDFDGLEQSLEFQLRKANGRKRVVLIGLDASNAHLKDKIQHIVAAFKPEVFEFVQAGESEIASFENAVILLKGTRNAEMQRYVRYFKEKNHTTYVTIDLSAIKNNLAEYRNLLKPSTQLLAMVKAQAYGSGGDKMVRFLEQQGINYLGVAYVDEGVELRKLGVKLPILVMNTEVEALEDCIRHDLEPAIFSMSQLDRLIKELIILGRSNYPIHIKIDTGMHRLGFYPEQMSALCDLIKAQPEVTVKSVYSHLADADNKRDKRFTAQQIKLFNQCCEQLYKSINYSFTRHILNSEGIANHSIAQFEMVRLGIGMYGISSNSDLKRKLQPAFAWYSAISQIKTIKKGESVGYLRSFIAEKETTIAIVPLGYADGFRRSLGNGKGQVFVKGKACKTVGRVCMDMIMIDVSSVKAKEGDLVEIIGKQQKIEQFASQMETIPYEVMTSISSRVQRIYLEE
ncbi:MAG: alanine racemase [Bacteroidota bacterium]